MEEWGVEWNQSLILQMDKIFEKSPNAHETFLGVQVEYMGKDDEEAAACDPYMSCSY